MICTCKYTVRSSRRRHGHRLLNADESRAVQGNLLDDTELIDVLATTKQTSQDVAEKLANASETNAKITEACEEFRPVAHRATLIYFLIAEFSVVNCMYQTSLAQFSALYELAIDHSDKATLPSKRIHNIIEYMTYEIYLYIQRGLFERHKLLFALMMANKVRTSALRLPRRRCQAPCATA